MTRSKARDFLPDTRWRHFTLKDGSTVSVGKLPTHEGLKLFWTWSILFERSMDYKMKHAGTMQRDEPSGGGSTLRAAMRKFRLRLALDQNEKLREAHKRVARK